MPDRLLRLVLATPLVALLGAAMVVAAWPEGDVTGRERELVARLTRGGVQRLEADGGHWTADAIDLADTGTPATSTGQRPHAFSAATGSVAPPPTTVTMLDGAAARHMAGRVAACAGRDRAPPRA